MKIRFAKLIKRKYAYSFLAGSSIRIGTLGDFRLQDSHSAGIGDSLEGGLIYDQKGKIVIKNGDTRSENILSNLEKAGIISISPGSIVDNTAFENCTFITYMEDCYIFSFTHFSNEIQLMYIADKFGYEAAIEILDVNVFLKSLIKYSILSNGTKFSSIISRESSGYVQYQDRKFDIRDEVAPPNPFQKDLFFAWQNEVRAVFFPVSDSSDIKPLIVKNSKIRRSVIQLF
jgi:hypothetical protein